MSIVDRKCQECKKPFQARSADVKRGWARFCSKSCKAKKQEKRTGQYRELLNSGVDPRRDNQLSRDERFEREHERALYDSETGWDGHKNTY